MLLAMVLRQQRAAADDPDAGLVAARLDAEDQRSLSLSRRSRAASVRPRGALSHPAAGPCRGAALASDVRHRPAGFAPTSAVSDAERRCAPPTRRRRGASRPRRRRRAGSSAGAGRPRRSPPTRTAPGRPGCRRAPRGTHRARGGRMPRPAAPRGVARPRPRPRARLGDRDGLDVGIPRPARRAQPRIADESPGLFDDDVPAVRRRRALRASSRRTRRRSGTRRARAP